MSNSSRALRRIFVLAGYAVVLAVIFIAAYVNDRSYYAYFWIAVVVMSPTVLAVELGLRIFERATPHAVDGMQARPEDQSTARALAGRSVGKATLAAILATLAGLFATVQKDWGPKEVPAATFRISVAAIAVLAALTSVCFARRKGTSQRRAAPWMLALTIAAFLTWYGALALETIAAGN